MGVTSDMIPHKPCPNAGCDSALVGPSGQTGCYPTELTSAIGDQWMAVPSEGKAPSLAAELKPLCCPIGGNAGHTKALEGECRTHCAVQSAHIHSHNMNTPGFRWLVAELSTPKSAKMHSSSATPASLSLRRRSRGRMGGESMRESMAQDAA